MLHSMKVLMAGVAIAVSTMFAGSAFAQDGETGAPGKPAVGPVSYTHLDVYKRQARVRRGFSSCILE